MVVLKKTHNAIKKWCPSIQRPFGGQLSRDFVMGQRHNRRLFGQRHRMCLHQRSSDYYVCIPAKQIPLSFAFIVICTSKRRADALGRLKRVSSFGCLHALPNDAGRLRQLVRNESQVSQGRFDFLV